MAAVNEWAQRGRERKAAAIEHALRGAGVDTLAALRSHVLLDPKIREHAERAAASDLGTTWRKPASAETWALVESFYRQVDESRALIPTTTED